MKNISIKAKLFGIIIATILIVSLIEAVESIYGIYSLSNNNIQEFKKKAYEDKEKELQSYVEIIKKSIDGYYQRTSKEKVKEEISEGLKQNVDFLFSILESEYEKSKGTLSKEQLSKKLNFIFEIEDLNETNIVEKDISEKD